MPSDIISLLVCLLVVGFTALAVPRPARAFVVRPISSCHSSRIQYPSSRLLPRSSSRSSLHANNVLDIDTIAAASQTLDASASNFAATSLSNLVVAVSETPSSPPPNVEALSNEANIAVFIIGITPFIWATGEFWRRIAVGASFGTGKDSIVIIGEDDAPQSSRGRQVLGKGALAVAYVLFGIAALSIGIAVFSVVTAPPMPADVSNAAAGGSL